MNIDRAQQIMRADDRIRVVFDGTPVWLERIDESNRTCLVHLEGDLDTASMVPVDRLHEA